MSSEQYALEDLRTFGLAMYSAAGMTEDDAAVVIDAQLEADCRGVDTHGYQRLPWYVERLLAGDNNPRPHITTVKETPASVTLDGDGGLGQLVCTRLAEAVTEKAEATGLAIGVVRRSNDWGCGARYPRLAARRGFVSFATTTSIPTLAPFGTRTRMTGNNPMAFAIPRREAAPIVLDMALTPVAIGKVWRAQAEGTDIPEAWGFLDRDGNPTSDPEAALRGVMPAIGGYKGTGLSLMMNVLAGILSGSAHSAAVANEGGKRGQLVLALAPGTFTDEATFYDDVDDMARQVKAAEPLPGSPGPFLPGEIEQTREDEARRRGIVGYPASVLAALRDVAARVGVRWPDPV